MPVDFRCDRGDYARVLISLIAREATGASSARHSLRPLLSRAEKNSRKPRAPRAAGSRSRTRRHCEERLVRRSSTSEGGSDEAIHSSISRQHGLLHGACHRARIRATRWLAMTGVSQLPRIGERKRRHPPWVLVEDQGAGDRRLGALAAVFAPAEPAVAADRRALGLLA